MKTKGHKAAEVLERLDLAKLSTPRSRLVAATKPKSVYAGETWLAYRPGEDHRFKKDWVSRTQTGVLCSAVSSRADLVENARLCQVKLKWRPK